MSIKKNKAKRGKDKFYSEKGRGTYLLEQPVVEEGLNHVLDRRQPLIQLFLGVRQNPHTQERRNLRVDRGGVEAVREPDANDAALVQQLVELGRLVHRLRDETQEVAEDGAKNGQRARHGVLVERERMKDYNGYRILKIIVNHFTLIKKHNAIQTNIT